MKIAILMLNKGRGSGVVAKQHIEYLLKQGHTIYFLHPDIGDGVIGAQNVDIPLGIDILPVHEYLPTTKTKQKQVSSMEYEEAIAYVPYYSKALENIIKKIDIVIVNHANLAAIAAASVCKQHNKPFVTFIHGTGIEPRHQNLYNNKIWKLIEKAILESQGIIVTTEYVRDKLVRNLIDIPINKFLVLACSVAMPVLKKNNTYNVLDKYNIKSDYVICSGALIKSKGPHNIVEASKHYSDLATTIFTGDGELLEELKIRIGNRGKFLGFVPYEDNVELIKNAKLLVAAPEKKEHFGLIYIEAMAGSTPTVAYEGGGVNSIITQEIGILTERNPAILGKEIHSLLLNQKSLDYKSNKSKNKAEKFYSIDNLGPLLNNWLIEILNINK